MLTCHTGPLQDLFRIYPQMEKIFRNIIRDAKLENGIQASEFQFKKERILILHHLLTNTNGLDRDQVRALVDAVLIRRDKHTIMQLLKVAARDDKSGASGFNPAAAARERIMISIGRHGISKEEALWREAHNFASLVPDYDFLKQLKTAPLDECLRDAAVDAERAAYAFLTTQVESLVAGFRQHVSSMQRECDKNIRREISSEEEQELRSRRADFVSKIEDLTRQRSKSYVLYSLEEGRIA
jgi:hypothetical protein